MQMALWGILIVAVVIEIGWLMLGLTFLEWLAYKNAKHISLIWRGGAC